LVIEDIALITCGTYVLVSTMLLPIKKA